MLGSSPDLLRSDPTEAKGLRDEARLRALAESGLMENDLEETYDRCVRLVSRLTHSSVALLSFVDDQRQVFKAQTGLKGPASRTRQTALSHSFCRHVVEGGAPLAVEDARRDDRFADNAAIEDLGVVAYLGVPIRAPEGQVLGSLCAIDPTPREWSARDMDDIRDVSVSVESAIALQFALRRARQQETFFHNILDELPIGVAVARTGSGEIVSLNVCGERLVADEIAAESARDYRGFGAEHGTGARYKASEYPLVRSAINGEVVRNEPMLYRRGDGKVVHLEVSSSPMTSDPDLALATFVDVSDRTQAEESAIEWRRKLTRILASTTDPIIVTDRAWQIIFVNAAMRDKLATGRDVVGESLWDAFPDWVGSSMFNACHEALRTAAPRAAEIEVQNPSLCFEARAFPSERDLTVYFRDVTAERRSVARRELLVRELDHRVKNLFSMVSGMIGLTARHSATIGDMALSLRNRIAALSKAHDLIRPVTDPGGEERIDASLQALVTALVAPHLDQGAHAITIQGPAVPLGAQCVTSLALVLHEMATNAAKYGALSATGGALSVSWEVEGDNLSFRWTESAGPGIAAPPRRVGFGSTLIEMTVTSQLRGRIDRDWNASGLRLEMRVPLSRLRD